MQTTNLMQQPFQPFSIHRHGRRTTRSAVYGVTDGIVAEDRREDR
jgi:hypothetical protein